MSIEAMGLALEALEDTEKLEHWQNYHLRQEAIEALRTAIQQAEGQHLLEAIEAFSATTREPGLIEKAISSGYFGVLPIKATIPMCKAGWGASGGELTFQEIGRIYEEMYKARPLLDDLS